MSWHGCRSQIGEMNTSSILTEDQVREIRRLHEEGYSVLEIKEKLKLTVGYCAIDKCRKWKTWRHVK